MTANNTAAPSLNTPPVPLAASGAVKGAVAYSTADGYWLPTPNAAGFATASGLPIIKGFLKIDLQTAYGNPCGLWKDVTLEVLSFGYAGRTFHAPLLEAVEGIAFSLVGSSCADDVHCSPPASVRSARERHPVT